jgi:hypothetical protein
MVTATTINAPNPPIRIHSQPSSKHKPQNYGLVVFLKRFVGVQQQSQPLAWRTAGFAESTPVEAGTAEDVITEEILICRCTITSSNKAVVFRA